MTVAIPTVGPQATVFPINLETTGCVNNDIEQHWFTTWQHWQCRRYI